MADSTNLSLGPNATLKLDRTVFDDEHHYREVAVRMTSGAFRFVTGHSDKAAYKITTPLATIGVRGTTLDILSQRGQTIVNLQDGAASVCTIALNASSSPGPATPPSSPRAAAAADRRSRRPTIRPGRSPQPAAPRQGFAARRNMRMRRPSSSTTAATPPACCAGADHGKFHPQRPVVRNAPRRGARDAIVAFVGTTPSPSPSPTPQEECVECYPPTPTPSPSPLGFANAARQRAVHQRATGDRSRFECRLDQRTWRTSASTR